MNVASAGRGAAVIVFHALCALFSVYAAFWIRFEGAVPPKYDGLVPLFAVLMVAVRLPLFSASGLNRGLWRYSGMSDVRRILFSTALGSALFGLIVYGAAGYSGFPRSVLLLDWLVAVAAVAGTRVAIRSYRDLARPAGPGGLKVLVVGAGAAGEMIVREMSKDGEYGRRPVGFLDRDPTKKGLTIHGVPILGGVADAAGIIAEHKPDEILIAIPSSSPAVLKELADGLGCFGLPIKTLPSMRDIVDGRVSVSQIRELRLEDLLPRPQVAADRDRLAALIGGRTVMVTGAGGTIGSELCRQASDFGAAAVVAYERHENSLYNIEMDFAKNRPRAVFYPVVGDISDPRRLQETLLAFAPDILFHAAAHKHVPMMEKNPQEAVRNNVLGTLKLALAAGRSGVGTFVNISTDKAVNPTSVMGATKRVAELVVASLDAGSKTRHITVRFGNVLGSSGSVVPLFREQIRSGGPVTVTHQEMRRFLMLIPEAVLLVLQAASIGEGGEIFVLDMGAQVKIDDLAKNLITLSGLEPGKDIDVVYTGLRPGEKLYEELFDDSEEVAATSAGKILRAVPRKRPDKARVMMFCGELEKALAGGDSAELLGMLAGFVGTYMPDGPAGAADVLAGLAHGPAARPLDGLNQTLAN